MPCSRCGGSFDEHFRPGHECKGFKLWKGDQAIQDRVDRRMASTMKRIEPFQPLHVYGNWVSLPNIDRTPEIAEEVRLLLRAQIDDVIPPKGRYRRCILFTNMENVRDLTTTITWKYSPNLAIMAEEVDKACHFLESRLEFSEFVVRKHSKVQHKQGGDDVC